MKKRNAIILLILIMSIGFAAISTTLVINGNSPVAENKEDFDIIFTNAILDFKDIYDTNVSEDKKSITFTSKELKSLGDESVLEYEVTNNSSNYDAEVVVNCGLKDGTKSEYTSITNVMDDDTKIVYAKNTGLGTVKIKLNKVSTEEITEEYECKLEFNAIERDTLGYRLTQFQKDSWKRIVENVKSGNTSEYHVGDTKKMRFAEHTNDCGSLDYNSLPFNCVATLDKEREVTVRIANMSECTTETSETACGFVIEFADVLENHTMNPSTSANNWGTNVGGWKDSKLRTYLNSVTYNSLPEDLRNGVAKTKVVSGYGKNGVDNANFVTEDYLYLLSSKEVWGTNQKDTVNNETKQLDYYKNLGVTITNYSGAIKQNNGTADYWWLRTASSDANGSFVNVENNGNWSSGGSYPTLGVSPAFRVA